MEQHEIETVDSATLRAIEECLRPAQREERARAEEARTRYQGEGGLNLSYAETLTLKTIATARHLAAQHLTEIAHAIRIELDGRAVHGEPIRA